MFRTRRADGSMAWVEINFKLAGADDDRQQIEVVGTLRDVTQRQKMEAELNALNERLAELATTDGLTGLANRRTFDAALRREYGHRAQIIRHHDRYRQFQGLQRQPWTSGRRPMPEARRRRHRRRHRQYLGSGRTLWRGRIRHHPARCRRAGSPEGRRGRPLDRALTGDRKSGIRAVAIVSVSLGVASRTVDTTDENPAARRRGYRPVRGQAPGPQLQRPQLIGHLAPAPALQPLANEPGSAGNRTPATAH